MTHLLGWEHIGNSKAKLINHFPDWAPFLKSFQENAERGQIFNFMDFESGVKFDFMLYKDSDYNWTAFERRRQVDFQGVSCWIASPEDLIISKLTWYHLSKSEKQLGDIVFLLEEAKLDKQYLDFWTQKLFINRYGLF